MSCYKALQAAFFCPKKYVDILCHLCGHTLAFMSTYFAFYVDILFGALSGNVEKVGYPHRNIGMC